MQIMTNFNKIQPNSKEPFKNARNAYFGFVYEEALNYLDPKYP